MSYARIKAVQALSNYIYKSFACLLNVFMVLFILLAFKLLNLIFYFVEFHSTGGYK